jgi:hypothetical protein
MTNKGSEMDWQLRIHFNLALWLKARTLPFVVWNKSLDEILNWADNSGTPDYLKLPHEYIGKRVRRIARGPLLMRDRRCLRIGLLGYRFLRKAGYSPELHFGVSPDSVSENRIQAHCWVCLEGQPVIGEPLPGMLTIHVHRAAEGGVVASPEKSRGENSV